MNVIRNTWSTLRGRSLLATSVLTLSTALVIPIHAADITWNVAGGGDWDTSAANWTGGASTFTTGDNVTFDNAAGGMIVVSGMSPASTTVNSSGDYTFVSEDPATTGADSILTGTLVKDGTGTLQLGHTSLPAPWGSGSHYTNGFTSVNVLGGMLVFTDHEAFGSATVTLADGTAFKGFGSAEGRYNEGNEDLDVPIILSGGSVELPLGHGESKDIWFKNVVSGAGGFHITGTHRIVSLSGENTFTGGVILESTSSAPNALQLGSYDGLGTGTLTASQTSNSGTEGGLLAGQILDGVSADRNANVNALGVTNPVVIVAGRYFNVSGASDDKDLLLSGVISGGGTLRKHKNDSTVTLAGTNTYTGGTDVVVGVLACNTVQSLGTGPLDIGPAGLLQLDYVGTRSVSSLVVDGGSPLPDGTYGSSSSPAGNQDDAHFAGTGTVTVGPPKDPTTTTLALTSGSNPSDIDTPVTFTATVAGGTVTGNVTFYDGLTPLGSDALNGSFQASITTSSLTLGAHDIIAQYEGDSSHGSSTSAPLVLTVIDERPTTSTSLALTDGTNPSAFGASLTYTATVTGASPTGEVTFHDRDILIGTSTLDGSFQAGMTTSTLPSGSRVITARYVGDANNQPSTDTYEQIVNPPPGNGKLKVFILAGQSNMQGHGNLEEGRDPGNPTGPVIDGGLGSLRYATVREPMKFAYLLDPANPVGGQPGWLTRDDVWVSYWDGLNGDANGTTVERRAGFLDAGFGVGASLASERIGPEYGFGLEIGRALADEVLIIKTAWGGKSLAVEFRPPSSGGTTGPNYLLMVEKVHEVLDNLASYYPGYNGTGYEISGFGWHQGWNDRVNSSHVAEYEVNLANLIRDVRTEFGVTDMPFVIANSGMANAPSGPGTLIDAQGNVSNPALYQEFAGTVVTVDTRPFDYGESQSPNAQDYHWNTNGESYFNIGTSMGEAMLAMQSGTTGSAFQSWASDPAQGLTAGVNDGPLDDPDFDGIANLLEFVLGGHPLQPSSATLPTTNHPSGGGSWTFEYDRSELSVPPATTQIVEYGSDLVGWTPVTIPMTSVGTVTITPGSTSDHVSVAIPNLGATGFARLRVSE